MNLDFDLNLLRILVALDRTRSVTRAALELNMSQSGFSTALAKLRLQVGDPLFVRARNQMEATPRALAMVDVARSMLAEVQSTFLELPVFDPAQAHVEFRLAMADVAEIVFLPRLLAHLSKIAPNVRVRSDPWLRGDLQLAMETGKVDLALTWDLGLQSDIARQTLARIAPHAILSPDHPLSHHQSLSLAQLAAEPLILTGQAAGIGFLIAAKSVLRFSDTKDDRKISEYVIIGTLASVAWAIFAAGLTQIQLNGLPPLGIPDLTP